MAIEKIQGLVLSIVLLVVTLITYRSRMLRAKPCGLCLLAFRLAHFGLGVAFLCSAIICIITDENVQKIFAIGLFPDGVIAAIGILLWNGKNCNKKQS
jgi:disulfide bond formation protein DsbB